MPSTRSDRSDKRGLAPDAPAEILDLFDEMEDAGQQDIDPDGMILFDATCGRPPACRSAQFEAVVVLHEVLEARVRPHALPFGRRPTGLLDRFAESFHRLDVRPRDDLAASEFPPWKMVGCGFCADFGSIDTSVIV
jgi:hypothetical protein